MSDNIPEPEAGEVFTMTNGEKIRIDFERIYIYKSGKSKTTTVELGWSPDTQSYLLDIEFDEFDRKVQANKAAWKAYWKGSRDYY